MSQTNAWYKNAIFIELNTRAYKDSNGDGWGDCGLTSKLDYIKSIGVDAIWLLPINPSPLRDDGYDVSDFVTFSLPTARWMISRPSSLKHTNVI